jgi:hypothetical protein
MATSRAGPLQGLLRKAFASYFVDEALLSLACGFQTKFFESPARSQIWFFTTAPSEYASPFK